MSRLLLLAPLGLCALLSGCRSAPAAAREDAPLVVTEGEATVRIPEGSPLRARVVVAAVTEAPLERTFHAPATVEAEPSRLAKISPPVPGRVVKLFVHFGDTVKAGAPLFALDSPELVAAQSDYLKARTGFAQATRTVARQADLTEHGIGAARELEQASAERDTAKSELDRASTRLKLLGMGGGAVGGPLTVTAPIAGRVIDVATAPGQYQSDPSQALLTVADLESVWVTANVPEKDLRRVHADEEATISFAAYPGETVAAKVLSVGDLLDPETRAVKVRIALPNREGRFKPGMFATVVFHGATVRELLVPTAAVVLRGERSWVYVEKGPWTFERQAVEVGDQHGDGILITSGLAAGARVVTRNAVLLP